VSHFGGLVGRAVTAEAQVDALLFTVLDTLCVTLALFRLFSSRLLRRGGDATGTLAATTFTFRCDRALGDAAGASLCGVLGVRTRFVTFRGWKVDGRRNLVGTLTLGLERYRLRPPPVLLLRTCRGILIVRRRRIPRSID
jgi:hypothetical protein